MKRGLAVLVLLALALTACAGPSRESSDDDRGIAALEDSDRERKEKERRRADGEPRAERPEKKRRESGKKENRGESQPQPGEEVDSTSAEKDRTGEEGPKPKYASAAAPIPAGRHDYATEGSRTVSGKKDDLPENTTLTAEAARSGEQRQVRDLRDRDGHGTVTESRVLYRPNGVFLTYVKVTATFPGGLTDVREFKLPQPELLAPTGARPGFGRTFSMRGSGTRARVNIDARRFGDVEVSERRVRALIVATRITFSGALQGEQNALSWFWPEHVMMLKEQVSVDVTNGPVRFQSDYEALLKRLP